MQWGMLSSLVILAWYLISLGVYSPSHFCPHFIWFIHSDITDVNYISFKHHYGMFGTAYHNIHVFFTNLYTVTSQKNTGEKDFQGSSRYKKKGWNIIQKVTNCIEEQDKDKSWPLLWLQHLLYPCPVGLRLQNIKRHLKRIKAGVGKLWQKPLLHFLSKYSCFRFSWFK